MMYSIHSLKLSSLLSEVGGATGFAEGRATGSEIENPRDCAESFAASRLAATEALCVFTIVRSLRQEVFI